MGRERITVDEALVTRAMEALGASSRTETIRLALMEVVRRERLSEVLAHAGRIPLDLDLRRLEDLRRQR